MAINSTHSVFVVVTALRTLTTTASVIPMMNAWGNSTRAASAMAPVPSTIAAAATFLKATATAMAVNWTPSMSAAERAVQTRTQMAFVTM